MKISRPINELCIELIRSLNIPHGEPVDPFKFQPPELKNCVSIPYPSAVLDGQFFLKGKMSDPDILYICQAL